MHEKVLCLKFCSVSRKGAAREGKGGPVLRNLGGPFWADRNPGVGGRTFGSRDVDTHWPNVYLPRISKSTDLVGCGTLGILLTIIWLGQALGRTKK
jgi:hypothetical protein